MIAIDGFARPVNSRKIPWFITFGNHDEDHTHLTGMDEDTQLRYYMLKSTKTEKRYGEKIPY